MDCGSRSFFPVADLLKCTRRRCSRHGRTTPLILWYYHVKSHRQSDWPVNNVNFRTWWRGALDEWWNVRCTIDQDTRHGNSHVSLPPAPLLINCHWRALVNPSVLVALPWCFASSGMTSDSLANSNCGLYNAPIAIIDTSLNIIAVTISRSIQTMEMTETTTRRERFDIDPSVNRHPLSFTETDGTSRVLR